MNEINELSDSISKRIHLLSPAVVRVEARRRFPTSGWIWDEQGLILTADHGIDRDDQISIGLEDGKTISAQIIGRDPTTDVALLKVENSGFPVIERSETDQLSVGNLVLGLARPRENIEVSPGMVTAIGPFWRTALNGKIDRYYRIDLKMYPGFSGGILVNARGKSIGMISSALFRGESAVIPIITLDRVVNALLKHGKVKRGYLGIGSQPVHLPSGFVDQYAQAAGLLVTAIEPDCPAENSGILIGDIVVRFNGLPIQNHDDLLGALGESEIGAWDSITIIRGGQQQVLKVTIGERA